jgi:hypothetical protein
MPIFFPSDPEINDEVIVDEKIWYWDGEKWILKVGFGSSATITVGSTTTGEPETDAIVENSGTSSDAIFDFTIPRGSSGPTGPSGPSGPAGPSGIGYSGIFSFSEYDFEGPGFGGVGFSVEDVGAFAVGDFVQITSTDFIEAFIQGQITSIQFVEADEEFEENAYFIISVGPPTFKSVETGVYDSWKISLAGVRGLNGSPGSKGESMITFSSTGSLSVTTGTIRYLFPFAATILGVSAAINTAPTGSSVLVDVNKNGTTVFTTQANRPEIAASANSSGTESVPDVTSISSGDFLQVDIDQVGSTVAGSDLTVFIRYGS